MLRTAQNGSCQSLFHVEDCSKWFGWLGHNDGQRKRKAARASAEAEESEGEDEDSSMHAQSRTSSRSKRSPRSQELSCSIVLKIKGDVNKISIDKFPEQQESRRPVAKPRPKQASRYAARCDTPEDLSSESEESRSSSDNEEPECNPPARPKRSMNQQNDQQLSERRAPKRYQPDEGYHTSSTAYRAEVNKRPAKGKAKEGTLPSRTGSQYVKPTQQVSLGKQKRSRAVTDNLGGPSRTRGNVDSDECSENEDGAGGAEEDSGASDDDQTTVPRDEDDEDSDDASDASDDQDESEDDFNKLAIQISGAGSQDAEALDVKAVLDTGTKPDWISQKYYERLKKIGIKSIKLSDEEKTKKYKDFQNRPFSPIAKVSLMVQSDDFPGKVKSRLLTFFISSNSGFLVLIGSDTIRKQNLFERSKPDTDGEGAHVGDHGKMSEAEKAKMKKRKERQDKIKEVQKRQRDEKNEEIIREKKSAKGTRSGNDSAHLATMVIRGGRTRSPLRSSNDVARQQLERKSNSSLEGTW